MESTGDVSGISVVSNRKITVANSGVYEITFSAQVQKTQGNAANLSIWFQKNGVKIDNSASYTALVSNSVYQIVTVPLIISLTAGDYLEIVFASDSQYVQFVDIAANAVDSSPQAPSLIVTAKQVGVAVGSTSGTSGTSGVTIQTGSFAVTGSNIFTARQIVSGGLDVQLGITGSLKGNVDGNATTATTATTATYASITTTATNFNYTFPFIQPGLNGQLPMYADAVGGPLYNPSTNKLELTGSMAVSGSITINSGSLTMPDRPAFRVVGSGGAISAPSVIASSSYVADYSQGSGWNQSTGVFTAPIAGLYQVNIVGRAHSNAEGAAQIIVYKNTTPQIMVEWAANTTANHIGGSTISQLAVGDTLKASVMVGTISFDSNDNFSVAYIG